MIDLQIRMATPADAPALSGVVLQLSASITARPFYERLGYETITFEERVNDGSTWLMRKSLG